MMNIHDNPTKGVRLYPMERLSTVMDFVRYGVTQFTRANLFFGHGTDNAYDESVYLVLRTLSLPLDDLDTFASCALTNDEKVTILNLIYDRVEQRVPLAYLMGEAYLRGHRFLTDPNVIVPRSPIAELLEDQLAPWIVDPLGVENVLDMCTGSGCLAILAALSFENALVDGVDINDQAIELAYKNHKLYGLDERVQFIQSDLFDQVPVQSYDLIICNPPYVCSDSMNALPDEYLAEPDIALDGGEDGMDFIRPFLMQAKEFLKPEGMIVLEVGHELNHFKQAFPEIEPIVLETDDTPDSVILITSDQLY